MVEQVGNRMNAGVPASGAGGIGVEQQPPAKVEATPEGPAPVRQINGVALRALGAKYRGLFDRYASERLPAEQKWLKNLRQYLGIYDPEIERELPRNRSRAYPRLTRVKCISLLSRIMNLMFPGNEDNWELKASPSPEMSPEDVAAAVEALIKERGELGMEAPLTQELVDEAVRRLAEISARKLSALIKDQLLEIGGGQTADWISLNRRVCDSGIKYGIGVLEGPYVRKIQQSGWTLVAEGGFQPVTREIFKPQYDILPVWDYYPDMSARTLPGGEGYFVRKVLGRSALRRLANRKDFFGSVIREVITNIPGGNYKAKQFETELRTMGLSAHAETTSNQASGRDKYEIIIWKGPVSAHTLKECGADVPDNMMADDVEAELWMVENYIIKAEINAWRKLGIEMQTVHVFSFDEDDTSPISQGLPGIVRDSQLSICAATRMALDNASVTCGPNLEVNTALLRADQDMTAIEPYKIWYRDDEGLTAQYPAVRRIEIDGHLNELQGLIKMFVDFAEMETFIGPGTGGDMTKVPSEAMRTAAGGSMLRGDAALPFKDIVRNYDSFTQSVIWSLVQFNRKFNPDEAPQGDYDVIARGATSLIAKEVRGMQIDMLSQTLTDDERDHIDERRFVEAKFAARDLEGMLVSEDKVKERQKLKAEAAAAQRAQAEELMQAEIKDLLTNAFKNVAQAQVNTAKADKTSVDAAVAMMKSEEGPPNDQNRKGKSGGAGSKTA